MLTRLSVATGLVLLSLIAGQRASAAGTAPPEPPVAVPHVTLDLAHTTGQIPMSSGECAALRTARPEITASQCVIRVTLSHDTALSKAGTSPQIPANGGNTLISQAQCATGDVYSGGFCWGNISQSENDPTGAVWKYQCTSFYAYNGVNVWDEGHPCSVPYCRGYSCNAYWNGCGNNGGTAYPYYLGCGGNMQLCFLIQGFPGCADHGIRIYTDKWGHGYTYTW